MDQFPEHLIETIFSYLIDHNYYHYEIRPRNDKLRQIFDLRLVCRKFLEFERYFVQNLVLGVHWSYVVYNLYQNNHFFWKKYLSYVKHLNLNSIIYNYNNFDFSILSHVQSLDIGGLILKDDQLFKLNQLRHLFCGKGLDISKLTKTNIHYHDCYRFRFSEAFYVNEEDDLCRRLGCLIRHHNFD